MTLEPMYLCAIAVLTLLSSVWVLAAALLRQVQGVAWKIIPCIIGWTLFAHEDVTTKLPLFLRGDAIQADKMISFSAGLLFVLNAYVLYIFLLRRGKTTWGRRLLMTLLFSLSQGAVLWWVQVSAGWVCTPFTVWSRMCTSYATLANAFLPFPVIGYWLMAVMTNEENTYATLSTFGHPVGMSKEGIDFDPEPLMSVAMFFQTIGLKTMFNRVQHFAKKSYNVQAEALQKSFDGIQMLFYFGAAFEIGDALRFTQVGEAFALAAAKDDLTSLAANRVGSRNADDVFALRLADGFVESFNRNTKPVERYGLRMVSATPWRSDYYDPVTRAFFNELGTIASHGTHLEAFMQEARRVYDKTSLDRHHKFTFEEYVAMFMALSGKGSTFGQYGFSSK